MKIQLTEEELNTIAAAVADKVHRQLQEIFNNYRELLSVEELAARLKVPVSWVYDHTRGTSSTGLPRYKVGKYVRFNLNEVLQWLKDQQI